MSGPVPPSTGGAGSASCILVNGDSTNLYNFTVQMSDSYLAWNEWFSSGPVWTTAATPFNADTDPANAMSSVLLTGNDGPEVHLFYTSGGTLTSIYLPLNTGEYWQADKSLNSLNISNCAPRSAITWTDSNGTHIRVYYVIATGQDGDMVQCELYEIAIDNGTATAPNLLRSFFQNGPQPFGDATAAVTWVDNSGDRQYRLYYYGGIDMVEWGKSDSNPVWGVTMNWELLSDLETRMPMTAVVYSSNNTNHIRVYRHRDQQWHRNAVHEYAWDDGAGWTDSDLPHDIIAGTFGPSQPNSLAWVTSDGQVHIRLYQLMNNFSLGNYCYIVESSYDTNSGWTANTGVIPLGADANGP